VALFLWFLICGLVQVLFLRVVVNFSIAIFLLAPLDYRTVSVKYRQAPFSLSSTHDNTRFGLAPHRPAQSHGLAWSTSVLQT
jgi:Flp pilus assembly protein protease CpaA